METVAFISTENGDDLIVSFAVIEPADPTEIDSLTLQRTPKYEHLLEDRERGVRVSFERYLEDDDELLEEFHLEQRPASRRGQDTYSPGTRALRRDFPHKDRVVNGAESSSALERKSFRTGEVFDLL